MANCVRNWAQFSLKNPKKPTRNVVSQAWTWLFHLEAPAPKLYFCYWKESGWIRIPSQNPWWIKYGSLFPWVFVQTILLHLIGVVLIFIPFPKNPKQPIFFWIAHYENVHIKHPSFFATTKNAVDSNLECWWFKPHRIHWFFGWYCWWFRNPANQLICCLSYYLQGFSTIPGGCLGFLVPTPSKKQQETAKLGSPTPLVSINIHLPQTFKQRDVAPRPAQSSTGRVFSLLRRMR